MVQDPSTDAPRDPAPASTKPKVMVVMPAYNAARTLRLTYRDMPRDLVDTVILVDDGSSDETLQIARELGLEVFIHNRNYGYGANQKTCYREALRLGADIVVMLHPDYQYDPTLLPEMIAPLQQGRADVVFGSRLMGINPVKQGMPWWKFAGNRFLTRFENWVFGLQLSEYHTGYRAYSRRALQSVNFEMNSDAFIFDQEIVAQFVCLRQRIVEIPVPTRYFVEASSISFWNSTLYGLSILWLLFRYLLHRGRVWPQRSLDSLAERYGPAASAHKS
jgi:glycosyltransferase involved in cell wall biosynthesis